MKAITAIVLTALGMAACSGGPTSPGALSSDRRVQTGGGGGTVAPVACTKVNCVDVTAAGGTLSGGGRLSQVSGDTSFTVKADLTGTGRFQFGTIDLEVRDTTALIRQLTYSNDGRVFGDSLVPASPSIRLIDEPGCDSGVLVETTITARLENFGPTTIVERHCTIPTR